ncbi:S-adenosyl-L-methionine-dependent methyltransferase [Thozetella sp. PMI_491]|nr:S-adenosyl-L-methionine-dependent methyltransferase [Thozetella sp. PMI_491]
MGLNSFAHLYEEATIDVARGAVIEILNKHLPPLHPDMHILDLAPPRITGVDIGPNFIDAFKENKETRGWDTAEPVLCDASSMSMLQDNTFDAVIMNFGLFAVPDAVADKAAAEIRRLLKPGARAFATTWRETWVERMLVGMNKFVGRPEEEWSKMQGGKWLKIETARDTLAAGGFAPRRIQHERRDFEWDFGSKEKLLDNFSSPFWIGISTAS